MKTLIVTITKTPTIGADQPVTWSNYFEGKTADKDCEAYLKSIHDEKMNIACINAGLGKFTESKITKPDPWGNGRWCDQREAKKDYATVQKQITYALSVKIETIN